MWKIKQLTADYKQRGLDPHRSLPAKTPGKKKKKRPAAAGEQERLF